MTISSSARLYLRPVAFADTPVNRDGEVARLAGGMQWFAAWELIAAEAGRRVHCETIPVAQLEQRAAALPQGEALLALAQRITTPRPPLMLGERVLRFDQPQTMAILNLTPDSFSDGGRYSRNPAEAVSAAVDMAAAGAAVIDVGGESTRPGASPVWEGDETARVVPVIEQLRNAGVLVSIDTRKAAVMEAALAAGAHLVNDVAALRFDERALGLVVQAGCPVVLMHASDAKGGADGTLGPGDPLLRVYDWLEQRVTEAVAAGIARERILIDPGIGFGKTLTESLALLNGLALLHGIGCPIVLGASRKRIVGALSNEASATQRLGGSIALALKGAEQGTQLLRVHDVFETVQALRVWRGMRDAALVAV